MSDDTVETGAPKDAAEPPKRKRGRPRKEVHPAVEAVLAEPTLGMGLSPVEIRALSELASGGSMRRAAELMGTDEKQMRQYLMGREKVVLRAAYQKLLIQIGITPERLARTVLEALDASRDVYDKEGNLVGSSPDHNVRLKAAGMAQKILQLEQPTELSARAPDDDGMGRIGWDTTLGDGKTIDTEGYEVPAGPKRPMKQLN